MRKSWSSRKASLLVLLALCTRLPQLSPSPLTAELAIRSNPLFLHLVLAPSFILKLRLLWQSRRWRLRTSARLNRSSTPMSRTGNTVSQLNPPSSISLKSEPGPLMSSTPNALRPQSQLQRLSLTQSTYLNNSAQPPSPPKARQPLAAQPPRKSTPRLKIAL